MVSDGMVDQFEGTAQAKSVRALVGDLIMLALEINLVLALEHFVQYFHIFASSTKWFAEGYAMPTFDDLRSRCAKTQNTRPLLSISSVVAVIAIIAGVRGGIWAMPVARRIVVVCAASQANGVNTSVP